MNPQERQGVPNKAKELFHVDTIRTRPIVIKKVKSYWMCVDYGRLNNNIVTDISMLLVLAEWTKGGEEERTDRKVRHIFTNQNWIFHLTKLMFSEHAKYKGRTPIRYNRTKTPQI